MGKRIFYGGLVGCLLATGIVIDSSYEVLKAQDSHVKSYITLISNEREAAHRLKQISFGTPEFESNLEYCRKLRLEEAALLSNPEAKKAVEKYSSVDRKAVFSFYLSGLYGFFSIIALNYGRESPRARLVA